MSGARRVISLVVLISCLLAVPGATARRQGGSVARTYTVDFIGSGTFNSDETHPIEGVGDCATATDRVVESDTLRWDVKYHLTLKAGIETVRGGYFDAGPESWSQRSTITPSGCFGGDQDCAGKLYPASESTPPTPGFAKRPEALFSVEGTEVQVSADSVLDWVVADPTGSRGCSAYARYHTALEPFSLAKHIHATNLTVAGAVSAFGFVPRRRLNGRTYTMTVRPSRSDQPPRDCARFAVDATSCDEVLSWQGKLVFKRL